MKWRWWLRCNQTAWRISNYGILERRTFSSLVQENNKDELLLEVTEEEKDIRIDRFLRRRLGRVPQSLIEKYVRKGFIRVDGQTVKRAGEKVGSCSVLIVPKKLESFDSVNQGTVQSQKPALSQAVMDKVQSWILYKDKNVLVINKPPNLACQGGSGLKDSHLDTLLPALALENEEPPKLVHRLDKQVSGTLLLARNSLAARTFASLFQQRQVRKLYWALVIGNPLPAQGEIRKPVDDKAAVTKYRVVSKLHRVASWLELEPITGRKRQLRLHCAQVLNCPIFGDEKYPFDHSAENTHFAHQSLIHLLQQPKGIHLHARCITFPNIETPEKSPKTWKTVTAPLPGYMEDTWNRLGFQYK